MFAVSPESGRVICATRFRLEHLHADELLGVMTLLSSKARQWREHFFVAPASAAPSHATSFGILSARRGNGSAAANTEVV